MTTLLFQMCATAPGWQDAEDPASGFVRARQALYQLARESPALSAVACAVSTHPTLPRDSRELALLGFPSDPNFLMAWDLGTLNFNNLLKLRVLLPPTSQLALGEPWRAGRGCSCSRPCPLILPLDPETPDSVPSLPSVSKDLFSFRLFLRP